MGYQVPDLVIFQGRWYDDSEVHDTNIRWTHWKNIEEWEYKSMLDAIDRGYNYQVRILKQIHIEGFGVDDRDKHPEITVNPGL